MDSSPASSSEKVLLVDDVPENLAVLTAALEPEGFEILATPSGAAALKVAVRAKPDLILLDIVMPELDGIETCRRLKEDPATRDIPVLFITARNETDSIVAGFQVGGVDYVVKPFRSGEVVSRVTTHLRLSRLARELAEKNRALETRTAELIAEIDRRREAETARQQADAKLAVYFDNETARWNVAGLIGSSRCLQKVVTDIHRMHQFGNTTVLIAGESGTGKELIARAIHLGGARAKAPFVAVNSVAIPADLAESMLFGHLKGAFTGATTDRKGYFELAHGGTIFLDEIGDMPMSVQAKLLRVLEDGCVTPVGASEPRHVDVRVIAATNADLHARIANSTFRDDLYFRLARYTVTTPPLRHRAEDIPLLSAHFLHLFATETGLKTPEIAADAINLLQAYEFPGNVRELRNVVERALIESGGKTIEARHVQLPRRHSVAAKSDAPAAVEELPLSLADAEEALIQRALRQTNGNIAEAARMLGVNRARIYRKMGG
ncbi:MAG TPA: sigma-54 dependent transcriptional regulator [Verrucomicrobiae bacterium]|jgi:DNA-binding NtrC family response regulator